MMFKRIRERLRRWLQTKSRKHPNLKEMQEDLEKCEIMQKKTAEERDALVNRVDELEAVLPSKQNKTERAKENDAELQAYLTLCEEQERNPDLEKESLLRDEENTKKRIVQLEATLASERGQWEQEKKEIELDMEERNAELQAFLMLCEQREKIAELQSERLTRDRKQLEKHVAQLEATLESERGQHAQEKWKIKRDSENRTIAFLRNINNIQASLKMCKEQQKTALLDTERLMSDREKMEKDIAQLKVTLDLQREHHEREIQTVKLESEKMTVGHLRKIVKLQASLKIFEEQQKAVVHDSSGSRKKKKSIWTWKTGPAVP